MLINACMLAILWGSVGKCNVKLEREDREHVDMAGFSFFLSF